MRDRIKKKEYDRIRYLDNRDEFRERGKKYYQNNKDKRKEYAIRNKNKLKESRKRWCEKNRLKLRLCSQNYFNKNKEVLLEKMKEYQAKNKERISIMMHKRYLRNSIEERRKNKEGNHKRRLLVISHYGGECKCCGEKRIEFLEIDHIGGGGCKERKALKLHSATAWYRYVIKNNFPDRYRILCSNCNQSMGKYGYCPHQNEKNNSL
jgi:hypothetical protein